MLSTDDSTIAVGCVVLLIAATYYSGVREFSVAGHVNIATWDLAIAALLLLWSQYLLLYPVRLGWAVVPGLILVLLFSTWAGVQGFRSPQPARGLTMVLMLLRGVVVFVMVCDLLASVPNLRRLNRAVFILGAWTSALSVGLYAYAITSIPLGGNRRPFGNIILMLDEGSIPRLIGFARDPNFYGLFMALALFCGLQAGGIRPLFRTAGLLMVGTSLLLTLSRSVFAFIPASLFLLMFLLLIAGAGGVGWRYSRALLVTIMAFAGIAVALSAFALGGIGFDVVETIAARFDRVEGNQRFLFWAELVNDPRALITGRGLRSAEDVLGAYSHNSYLDILFETGLPGFLLWLGFAALTLFHGIRTTMQDPEMLPWVHIWLLTLFMYLTLSVVYIPWPWLVAAVIWSQAKRGGRDEVVANGERDHPDAQRGGLHRPVLGLGPQ